MVFALCLLVLAGPAAPKPILGEALVARARKFLGEPYVLGGRMHSTPSARPGIDCMGLVFAAAEGVQRCGWRSFSYNPTTLLADGSLGAPVAGLSPVSTADLDVGLLTPGDVLMLVQSTQNPNEPAIGKLGDVPVWVWHMGLYAGAGKWLVGDHFAGAVVEVELLPYLKEHAEAYDGVFVLRPRKVAPRRCSPERMSPQ